MREIKFRAWDKDKKYMVYDEDREWMPQSYPVWVSNRGIVYCKRLEFKPGDGNFEFDAYKHENIEIMQFTGLKDKNGKEIYEGDIVKADGVERVIEFRDGAFTCKNSYPSHTLKTGWIELEVIGNLYENPELKI